jgi:hypothetical protein
MKYYLIIIILIDPIFFYCTERDRLNPFDSKGNIKSPIQLSISPAGQSAKLDWTIQNITDFKGFRLYRARDDNNFNPIADLSPQTRSYLDSLLDYYHWFQYRISILGYQNESLPSQPVKFYPGPGKVWLLTRYGYSIRQLSYDLLHAYKVYNTNYPPINWDLDLSREEIWLAHSQYRYISKMNIPLGYEDFFLQNDFQQPIDIKLDSHSDRVIILDSQGKAIFLLKNQMVQDSIALDQNNYFKTLVANNSEIVVLNDNSACIFKADGDSLDRINFEGGFSGRDMILQDSCLYILISNSALTQSQIITYNRLNGQLVQLNLIGNYTLFDKPVDKNYLYLSEVINSNSTRLVKLSIEGNRLLELPVLTGNIDDIAINQYDHSIIVLQRYQDNLVLYDSLGQMISTNNQIYDPIKISIQ